MNMSEEELAGLMEEVRPMMLVSLDEVDSADHPLHETIHYDCYTSALGWVLPGLSSPNSERNFRLKLVGFAIHSLKRGGYGDGI